MIQPEETATRIPRDSPRSLALRAVRPERIAIRSADLVRKRALHDQEAQPLPMVFEAAAPDVDLAAWASAHLAEIDTELCEAGAILFRGFGIRTPRDLESVASVFVDELFSENGEHPRVSGNGRIYTPTYFPPGEKLLWHHENAFNNRGPSRIFFCCAVPAAVGGETPIADGRAVYRDLPADLREEFEHRGVRYRRVYNAGLGLTWQEVFMTRDRADVEAQCARDGLEFEWQGDTLVTTAVRPAVIRHPITGAKTWFNQITHWHPAALGNGARVGLDSAAGINGLPRSFTFGDGGEVPDDAVAEVCAAYRRLEVAFEWQAGDLLMLDNILTAHARNPFTGERRLFVSMGGMVEFN